MGRAAYTQGVMPHVVQLNARKNVHAHYACLDFKPRPSSVESPARWRLTCRCSDAGVSTVDWTELVSKHALLGPER
jgi:hypothetical protein